MSRTAEYWTNVMEGRWTRWTPEEIAFEQHRRAMEAAWRQETEEQTKSGITPPNTNK